MEKKSPLLLLTLLLLTLLLSFTSVSATDNSPIKGKWTFSSIEGYDDPMGLAFIQATMQNYVYYIDDYTIYYSIADGEKKEQPLTLIQENSTDSPVDIGTCNKYIIGAGSEANPTWISNNKLIITSTFNDASNNQTEFYIIFDHQSDSLDDLPSSNSTVDKIEVEPENEPDPSLPLHYEITSAILDYVSHEYANPNMITTDIDPTKVLLVTFDYTNKADSPRDLQKDFSIHYYQHGKELSTFLSTWKAEYAPETFGHLNNTVLKDATITITVPVILEDYSPLTIIVQNWTSIDAYSDPMVIELEKPKPTPTPTPMPTPKAPEVKPLNPGDTVFTKDYHFTLNFIEFTKEVLPPDTSNVYGSFESSPGTTYIHIDGYYYNPTTEDACVRDLPIATAVYDGKYKYTPINGHAFADQPDLNSFTYGSSFIVCVPLSTCHYHCAIEVPDNVVNSDQPLYVDIPMADGAIYRYYLRANPPQINTEGEAPSSDLSTDDTQVITNDSTRDITPEIIAQVQKALNQYGYDCGTPDGSAGQMTAAAVSNYQSAQGLEVTGIIDEALLDSLGI